MDPNSNPPPDAASGHGTGTGHDPTRYVSIAPRSIAVILLYFILAVLLLLYSGTVTSPWVTAFIAALFLIYLARYISTFYVLDSDQLKAWRLFGSRRIRFEEIRSVALANLRDLGPVGFVGTWGWRGRVWSPVIGHFDTVHTVSPGLLVTAGRVPLFISPRDPAGFARELSRRARSWGVELAIDPGPLTRSGSSDRR